MDPSKDPLASEGGDAAEGAAPSQGAPPKARVLCVEDLHAVAQAITEQVNGEPDLQSVGVLNTPDRLLHEVRRLKADIVLLDLYFGGRRDAFFELSTLSRAEPSVRVIVVSGDNHPDTIRRAFALGARGYVIKGEPRELLDAIRSVRKGGLWRPGDASVEHLADGLVAVLGDPVFAEGCTWRWQIGKLSVEARADDDAIEIDLPWPLQSIKEPPPFGEVQAADSVTEARLRFVVRSRSQLELVVGVIAFEGRP